MERKEYNTAPLFKLLKLLNNYITSIQEDAESGKITELEAVFKCYEFVCCYLKLSKDTVRQIIKN